MKKLLLCVLVVLYPVMAFAAQEPLVIQEQGSFLAGGSTLTDKGEFVFSDLWSQSGQTAYGDNAYVWYQVPVNAKKLPMVFLHGGGQSKRTWETTPDGREGFTCPEHFSAERFCYVPHRPAQKRRSRLHAGFRRRDDPDALRPHNVHAV